MGFKSVLVADFFAFSDNFKKQAWVAVCGRELRCGVQEQVPFFTQSTNPQLLTFIHYSLLRNGGVCRGS